MSQQKQKKQSTTAVKQRVNKTNTNNTPAPTTTPTTSAAAAVEKSSSDVEFTIATGSYEQLFIGLSVKRSALRELASHVSSEQADTVNEDAKVMPTIFARACHTGSIRAVAASHKYLVTGSSDETMHIFSLRRRRELGILNHHSGAINAITLFGVHALVASDDGTVSLWRTGAEWQLHAILGEKKKAPILDIALHPSGRVLLTVGKDRRLSMWNLVNAKLVYKQKHAAETQRVAWSPLGTHYALVQSNKTLLFTAENKMLHAFEATQPYLTVAFSPDGKKIALGNEDKTITLHSVPAGKLLWTGAAHQRRVKDVRFLDNDFLVTICSLGDVRVWHVSSGRCLVVRKLDCRLNTVAVAAVSTDEPIEAGDDEEVEYDDEFDGNDDGDDDDDDEGGYIIEGEDMGDDDEVADGVLRGRDDDDNDDDAGNKRNAAAAEEDEEDDDAEFQAAVANNFSNFEKLAVETVDTGVMESLREEVGEDRRITKRMRRLASAKPDEAPKKKAKKAAKRRDAAPTTGDAEEAPKVDEE